MTRLSTVLALLAVVVVLLSSFESTMGQSDFCDSKCTVRCSKAKGHEDCMKYCGICCRECNCVPSGTFGNKDECPCYRDKFTGEGSRRRPKCP